MKTICSRHRVVRPLKRLVACLVLGTALAACDRPFEEPPRPRIDVIQPDLEFILPDREPQLAIRVTSSATIEQVVAGDDTLAYDEAENLWRGLHVMTNGLNAIVFSITDTEMRTTRDTAYAIVDVLLKSRSGPHLPSPRGGHTATRLDDGTILLIGGAPHATGPALGSGLRLEEGGVEFEPLEPTLNVPRTGHTATLLPDGRILLIGGSRRDEAGTLEDLVETVETFDPSTGAFEILPVLGEPIRRTEHTATLHEENGDLFVDLYGGTGDVSYRPPILGTRADVRRFLIQGDSLTALDPAPGPMMDEMLAGHSQIELYPNVLGNRRFHVTGGRFEQGFDDGADFEVEYHPQFGLLQHATSPLLEARTDHAAALLENGFVGIFGGRRASRSDVLNDIEIYSAVAERSFRYPELSSPIARFAHTATKVENERIHLFGGFSPTAEGVVTSELYSIPYFEGGINGKTGLLRDSQSAAPAAVTSSPDDINRR
jgi:hypothetical protein